MIPTNRLLGLLDERRPWAKSAADALAAGDYELAEAEAKTHLAGEPDHAPALLTLARALLATRRHSDALPVLLRLRDLAPADPTVHATLGDCLANTGRYGPAIHVYVEALRLQPDFLGAVESLGQVVARRREELHQAAQEPRHGHDATRDG